MPLITARNKSARGRRRRRTAAASSYSSSPSRTTPTSMISTSSRSSRGGGRIGNNKNKKTGAGRENIITTTTTCSNEHYYRQQERQSYYDNTSSSSSYYHTSPPSSVACAGGGGGGPPPPRAGGQQQQHPQHRSGAEDYSYSWQQQQHFHQQQKMAATSHQTTSYSRSNNNNERPLVTTTTMGTGAGGPQQEPADNNHDDQHPHQQYYQYGHYVHQQDPYHHSSSCYASSYNAPYYPPSFSKNNGPFSVNPPQQQQQQQKLTSTMYNNNHFSSQQENSYYFSPNQYYQHQPSHHHQQYGDFVNDNYYYLQQDNVTDNSNVKTTAGSNKKKINKLAKSKKGVTGTAHTKSTPSRSKPTKTTQGKKRKNKTTPPPVLADSTCSSSSILSKAEQDKVFAEHPLPCLQEEKDGNNPNNKKRKLTQADQLKERTQKEEKELRRGERARKRLQEHANNYHCDTVPPYSPSCTSLLSSSSTTPAPEDPSIAKTNIVRCTPSPPPKSSGPPIIASTLNNNQDKDQQNLDHHSCLPSDQIRIKREEQEQDEQGKLPPHDIEKWEEEEGGETDNFMDDIKEAEKMYQNMSSDNANDEMLATAYIDVDDDDDDDSFDDDDIEFYREAVEKILDEDEGEDEAKDVDEDVDEEVEEQKEGQEEEKNNKGSNIISARSLKQASQELTEAQEKKQQELFDEFMKTFQRLLEFRKVHGNVNVPQQWPDDKRLGRWYHTQKKTYNRWLRGEYGGMSEEKREIFKAHGINLISIRHQRQQEFEEKVQAVAAKRAQGIYSNPGLTQHDPRNTLHLGDFMSNFRKLLEFRKKHGNHIDVPQNWSELESGESAEDTSNFVRWFYHQKKKYRLWQLGNDAGMPQDRRELFRKYGICLTLLQPHNRANLDAKWHEAYKELIEFKNVFGHTRIPKSHNAIMAVWVIRQRLKFKDGTLEQSYITKLESIGFEFELRRDRLVTFCQRVEQLQAFKKRFGHVNVSYRWPENPGLGRWLCDQKTKQTGKGRRKILSDLGVELGKTVNDLVFETRVKELTKYKEEFGHTNVLQSYTKVPGLSKWLYDQVNRGLVKGKETEEKKKRRRMLIKLGVKLEPPEEDPYDTSHLSNPTEIPNDTSQNNVTEVPPDDTVHSTNTTEIPNDTSHNNATENTNKQHNVL